MKKLVFFGLVALGLFVLSATVSYYLRRPKTPQGEPTAETEAPGKGRQAAPNGGNGQERVGVRPPYTPGTETVAALAKSAEERLRTAREKEARVDARERQLKLVFEDIKNERGSIDDMRKQVGEELKAVTDKLAEAERRQAIVEQQRQEVTKQVKDVQKQLLELEGVERKNIEKMAAMYDSMDPEKAAKQMQLLADTGKMDTAVKLLSQMKERQAAKVLAELPDPTLAPQLLERLRGLKRTAPSANAPPALPPAETPAK